MAIVPLETCKLNYMNRFTVTDTMMCAADPGQDACQGDSGKSWFCIQFVHVGIEKRFLFTILVLTMIFL